MLSSFFSRRQANEQNALFRHGEIDLNQQGIYQSILDSPLTIYGKKQVRENGPLLKQNLGM